MAVKLSTKLRTALMTAGGGSLPTIFNDAEIRIFGYTGVTPVAAPTSADDATTGSTLLATVTGPSAAALLFTTSGATLLKDSGQVWGEAANVVATGTAVFWRLVDQDDTNAADTTTYPRIQGTLGTAGADGNLSSLSLTLGGTQTIDYFACTLPES